MKAMLVLRLWLSLRLRRNLRDFIFISLRQDGFRLIWLRMYALPSNSSSICRVVWSQSKNSWGFNKQEKKTFEDSLHGPKLDQSPLSKMDSKNIGIIGQNVLQFTFFLFKRYWSALIFQSKLASKKWKKRQCGNNGKWAAWPEKKGK